jgi:hypothetical protein
MSSTTPLDQEYLRGRLLDLGQRFIGFDKVVEVESSRAKKIESERAEILFNRISEMEKQVHGEIRNRTEMNREFQDQIELFCNTIIAKMSNRVSKRVERILAEIELMQTRLTTLERGQKQFRGELPSKLQVDTAALVKELQDSRARLEDEVSMWRAREEALIRKIELTNKNTLVQVDKFSRMQTDMVSHLYTDLEKLRKRKDNKSEYFIRSISELRQSLQLEEENRKFSDQEILSAVKNYTKLLQRGLQQVINSS